MNESDPFNGKTFVFTGEMTTPRDDAAAKVIMLGGRVTTQPSSKTTYLVIGSEPGPSKTKKAEELKIKILHEEEFLKMVKEAQVNFNDITQVNKNPPAEQKGRYEMWCEKYRPRVASDLIGNHTIVGQLRGFLKGETDFKAALLSGHPGTGKTTSAYICSEEEGLQVVEFDASDTRNKGEIEKRIKDTLNYYSLGRDTMQTRKVLLMDEIDGMTSDRGGLLSLTALIKNSKVPIICICNDRNNLKIRTLANYCLDLRFRKLDARQIVPRINQILDLEGKQMKETMINEVIKAGNGDLRFILNTLQNLLLRDSLSHEHIDTLIKKNTMKNIFEVASEVFHNKRINEKNDLYFEDYSMVPLFVQENYLLCNYKNISEIKQASESISFADVIDKHIHGYNQEWGLLPVHAFYSTIYPTRNKNLMKRINFPMFLGQNSKRAKNLRNLSEVLLHCHRKLRINKFSFRLDCLDLMFKKHTKNLIMGNIQECVDFVVEYDLLKNDIDVLSEISLFGSALSKEVSTKNKSAYTRAYKKLERKLPYSVDQIKKVISTEEEDDGE